MFDNLCGSLDSFFAHCNNSDYYVIGKFAQNNKINNYVRFLTPDPQDPVQDDHCPQVDQYGCPGSLGQGWQTLRHDVVKIRIR